MKSPRDTTDIIVNGKVVKREELLAEYPDIAPKKQVSPRKLVFSPQREMSTDKNNFMSFLSSNNTQSVKSHNSAPRAMIVAHTPSRRTVLSSTSSSSSVNSYTGVAELIVEDRLKSEISRQEDKLSLNLVPDVEDYYESSSTSSRKSRKSRRSTRIINSDSDSKPSRFSTKVLEPVSVSRSAGKIILPALEISDSPSTTIVPGTVESPSEVIPRFRHNTMSNEVVPRFDHNTTTPSEAIPRFGRNTTTTSNEVVPRVTESQFITSSEVIPRFGRDTTLSEVIPRFGHNTTTSSEAIPRFGRDTTPSEVIPRFGRDTMSQSTTDSEVIPRFGRDTMSQSTTDSEVISRADVYQSTTPSEVIPRADVYQSTTPSEVIPRFGRDIMSQSTTPSEVIPQFGRDTMSQSTTPSEVIPQFGRDTMSQSTTPSEVIPQFGRDTTVPQFTQNTTVPQFTQNTTVPQFTQNTTIPQSVVHQPTMESNAISQSVVHQPTMESNAIPQSVVHQPTIESNAIPPSYNAVPQFMPFLDEMSPSNQVQYPPPTYSATQYPPPYSTVQYPPSYTATQYPPPYSAVQYPPPVYSVTQYPPPYSATQYPPPYSTTQYPPYSATLYPPPPTTYQPHYEERHSYQSKRSSVSHDEEMALAEATAAIQRLNRVRKKNIKGKKIDLEFDQDEIDTIIGGKETDEIAITSYEEDVKKIERNKKELFFFEEAIDPKTGELIKVFKRHSPKTRASKLFIPMQDYPLMDSATQSTYRFRLRNALDSLKKDYPHWNIPDVPAKVSLQTLHVIYSFYAEHEERIAAIGRIKVMMMFGWIITEIALRYFTPIDIQGYSATQMKLMNQYSRMLYRNVKIPQLSEDEEESVTYWKFFQLSAINAMVIYAANKIPFFGGTELLRDNAVTHIQNYLMGEPQRRDDINNIIGNDPNNIGPATNNPSKLVETNTTPFGDLGNLFTGNGGENTLQNIGSHMSNMLASGGVSNAISNLMSGVKGAAAPAAAQPAAPAATPAPAPKPAAPPKKRVNLDD